jgi:hypothetical protein
MIEISGLVVVVPVLTSGEGFGKLSGRTTPTQTFRPQTSRTTCS